MSEMRGEREVGDMMGKIFCARVAFFGLDSGYSPLFNINNYLAFCYLNIYKAF